MRVKLTHALNHEPIRRTGAYAFAVWRRLFLVWRQLFWSSMANNVINPLLFLFAFGFGLGAVVRDVDGVNYLDFIVPGMIAHAAMFAASFETTISAFARFNMQKTWGAMLATPLRLVEILLGELSWGATKGMIAASCVLVVGFFWGGVDTPWTALWTIPIMIIASLGFAAYGLFATSLAKDWEFFSYFFTFWITPMFIFSGVFFEVSRFPRPIEAIAWLLPMTHVVAVIRPLTTGLPLDAGWLLIHLTYLIALPILAFGIAHKRLADRIFN